MQNKEAFITGGGSKLGKHLVDRLIEDGFSVDSISSTGHPKANNARVNWNDLDYDKAVKTLTWFNQGTPPPYDYIFLVHNAQDHFWRAQYGKSDGWIHKQWRQAFFNNLELVNIILTQLKNRINDNTVIVSFSTGLVRRDNNFQAVNQDKFAGYAGIKMNAYFLMQGYNKHMPGRFTCIDPGHMNSDEKYKDTANIILDRIDRVREDDFPYGLYRVLKNTVEQVSWTKIKEV